MDRTGDLVGFGAFADESARAGAERGDDELVFFEGGQDQHFCVGEVRVGADRFGRADPVQDGHADVHQDDVWWRGQALVDRLGCKGIWGDTSAKDKEKYWDEFLNDPECKVIVLNPIAAGIGLDGAQHVCQDCLYVEPPIAVSHWTQSLSRVHREGQRKAVTVRMAVALGTIQQDRIRSLSDKEALVNPIQLSKAELRAALFGEYRPSKSCLVTA